MNRFFSQAPLGVVAVPPTLMAVAVSAAMLSSSAQAQEEAASFGIEEVVVSARKIKESSQDTPVAVSAFNADSMKSLGITNLKEFDGVVPGLNMGGGGNGVKGDSNPFIRGVGQRETKVTIDGAVATYVDGVYIGRAAGALLDAVDVESIEVLRGPQGTLFGKNTTGGAIVITTAKPSEEFGGHVDVTLGNLGRRNVSGAVNLPINDQWLSRFTVSSTKNDGWSENQEDGVNWSDDDRLMGIAQLRWLATDTLTVDTMLSATKTRQHPRGQKCRSLAEEYDLLGGSKPPLEELLDGKLGEGSVQAACNEDLDTDEFRSEFNQNSIFGDGKYEVDTMMASITADWAVTDIFSVKSITAWRRTEQTADEDLDGTGLAITGRQQPFNNRTNQYSQEFQFNGDFMDGRLRYVAGLFGFVEQTDADTLQDYAGYAVVSESAGGGQTNTNITLAQSQWTVRDTDNTAWAAFGQMYFDITEHIELTLGLRYTDETRKTFYKEGNVKHDSIYNVTGLIGDDVCSNDTLQNGCSFTTSAAGGVTINQFADWQYGFDVNGNGVIDPGEVGVFGQDEGERSDDAWSPAASIKFLATDEILDTLKLDDAMIYFTYSEGFRSGGVTVANGDFSGNGLKDLENFDPEFVTNYEIGLKLDGFDRRLRSNFAFYFTDYEDIQVTTVIAEKSSGLNLPLPAIQNAGQAEIKGVEGEITFLATRDLRFMLNFAYTDARYIDYEVASSVLGSDVPSVQRADEPMPRVADWTAFLSADYTFHTDDWGMIIPSVNFRYTDEIYHGFDRDSYLTTLAGGELYSEATVFVDARVSWFLPDDRTTVTLWGKNLTNEDDYLVGGVPLVSVARSSGVVYADPMTFGVDVSYRFGE